MPTKPANDNNISDGCTAECVPLMEVSDGEGIVGARTTQSIRPTDTLQVEAANVAENGGVAMQLVQLRRTLIGIDFSPHDISSAISCTLYLQH